METKITCNSAFLLKLKEYYSLFGFIQTEQKKKLGDNYTITFYIERELEPKEKQIMNKYKLAAFLPNLPLIIFCVIGFILTTAFLVSRFVSTTNIMTLFYSLMIPAIIFIAVAAVYSSIRMLNINKNVKILSNLNVIKAELYNEHLN